MQNEVFDFLLLVLISYQISSKEKIERHGIFQKFVDFGWNDQKVVHGQLCHHE